MARHDTPLVSDLMDKFLEDETFREMFESERAVLLFIEELARIMRSRNWKKKELAEKLGVSRSYVSQLMQGRKNVSLKTAAAMLYKLGKRLEIKFVNIDDGKTVNRMDTVRRRAKSNIHFDAISEGFESDQWDFGNLVYYSPQHRQRRKRPRTA